MTNAIITGASSGIGKACSKQLLKKGYKVFALSRNFNKCDINDKNFIKIELDLTDTKSIKNLDKLNPKVLINSAGVGYFAPHEELSYKQIENMIDLNLKAPLFLIKHFLRELKENGGYIFNINSISALQPSSHGATYSATKAALRHFGSSLFKEARKSGLKVININPDITKTPFFDNLNFYPTDDITSYIEPEDIANFIVTVLDNKESTIFTDVTIQPQKFKLNKRR